MLTGADVSVQLIPAIAITGNVAWSPAKDRITAGEQTLDLYMYDVGAELRPSACLDHRAWRELHPDRKLPPKLRS
ncbi:MAG TPA: hypothetical protein VFW98_18010 [Gemmatimonadaceae bacterium]|nr:hypothetical protein [Gemmatimonadaceae bacterium]